MRGIGVVVALALPATSVQPGAAAGAGADVAAAVRGGATAATVTLVTGDRVRLTTAADGTQSAALLPDPAHPGTTAYVRRVDGHVHVIPAAAAAWLAAGRLDPDLFDVTALVADGFDDAHTTALPLLVEGTAAAAAATRAPAASTLRTALPELGIRAVSTPRSSARAFWSQLASPASGARTTQGFAQGVSRLWLDGRVHASLDRSVAQIGAPAAYAEGIDGRGVTVAVLDTGIDDQHPDLARQVTAERDFTGEGTTDDLFGHGTHVASIVAGTGAKSSGRYRGVAPGARLLDGRVLDSSGGGSESGVLAGMVWATRLGARVVNMSLGSGPTDGRDPMSLAVNRLSARTGTLFVIAAGNDGMASSVNSPGAADAALTVGAVDRDDSIASFSSRGPRLVDSALKPEITGPGVEITAAQADGTQLGPVVAPGYVALSGTSMATPHVAGAAALLAQQHPDWTGQLLKAALVGSSVDTPAGVFDEGGGRVDVARAVSTVVTEDDATLDLGFYDWPQGGDPLQRRSITYTNRGTAAVDLRLSVAGSNEDGEVLPAAAVSLSRSTLRLAPGADARVEVTFDPDAAGIGTWGGALTAAVSDGSEVRAPLGFTKESERYVVDVDVLGRDGKAPDFAVVELYNPTTGELLSGFDSPDSAHPVFRVEPGTWSVGGYAFGTGRRDSISLLLAPTLRVRADATVTLDARRARSADIDVTGVTLPVTVSTIGYSRSTENRSFGSTFLTFGDADLFATPTSQVRGLTFSTQSQLQASGTSPTRPVYDLFSESVGRVPAQPARHYRTQDLARVRNDFPAHGPAAGGYSFAFPMSSGGSFALGVPVQTGTSRQDWRTTTTPWFGEVSLDGLPDPSGFPTTAVAWQQQPFTLAPGASSRVRWGGSVIRHSVADVPPLRFGNELAVYTSPWTDSAGHVSFSTQVDRLHTALRSGGRTIAEAEEAFLRAAVPAARTTYELTSTASKDWPAWQRSTSVTSRWTFTSARVTGQEPAPLRLLSLGYRVALDARNSAPAGTQARVGVDVVMPTGVSTPRSDLRAQVAYGAGAWRAVPVTRTGDGSFDLLLDQPSAPGAVSLRVVAQASSGETITQEVRSAWVTR